MLATVPAIVLVAVQRTNRKFIGTSVVGIVKAAKGVRARYPVNLQNTLGPSA